MPTPEPTGAGAVPIGANQASGVRLSATLITANAAIARLINHSGPNVEGQSMFQRSSSNALSAR
jgi:hypothetical protein